MLAKMNPVLNRDIKQERRLKSVRQFWTANLSNQRVHPLAPLPDHVIPHLQKDMDQERKDGIRANAVHSHYAATVNKTNTLEGRGELELATQRFPESMVALYDDNGAAEDVDLSRRFSSNAFPGLLTVAIVKTGEQSYSKPFFYHVGAPTGTLTGEAFRSRLTEVVDEHGELLPASNADVWPWIIGSTAPSTRRATGVQARTHYGYLADFGVYSNRSTLSGESIFDRVCIRGHTKEQERYRAHFEQTHGELAHLWPSPDQPVPKGVPEIAFKPKAKNKSGPKGAKFLVMGRFLVDTGGDGANTSSKTGEMHSTNDQIVA